MTEHDVVEKLVIIGSGPAGLTAALYSARANLNPLLIEGAQIGGIAGGQLMYASKVENFPAFPQGLEGPALIQLMRNHVNTYNMRKNSTDVLDVNLNIRPFEISCSDGNKYITHALIIATGASAMRLPLESEKKFWGKGISTCANCDGGLPIYRNKILAVIGGGDTALEHALHLTQFGSKIFIIHHYDKFNASKIMQHRVFNHSKIEILWNKTVIDFFGDNILKGIQLKDEITGGITELKADGVFEAIGHSPNTQFIKNQLNMDTFGFILNQPETTKTSIEGVFSAGDISDNKYRQAITAAASGCMAAMDAEQWLQEKALL